jgi:uncharacterized protein YcbK (DUF882 family)
MEATPHFQWSELTCKCGCGTSYVSVSALDKLEAMRNILGKPMYLNSVCRCPIHNAKVGGAPLSQHRSTKERPATAFDISLQGQDKDEIIRLAERVGFKGIGINYKTFVHVDDRSKRARW